MIRTQALLYLVRHYGRGPPGTKARPRAVRGGARPFMDTRRGLIRTRCFLRTVPKLDVATKKSLGLQQKQWVRAAAAARTLV